MQPLYWVPPGSSLISAYFSAILLTWHFNGVFVFFLHHTEQLGCQNYILFTFVSVLCLTQCPAQSTVDLMCG